MNMPLGGGNLNNWLVQCASVAQGTPSDATQRSLVGQYWIQGLPGSGMGTIVVPPNSNYPYCVYSYGGGDNDGSIGSIGLSSYHPGGANVTMADGSVRFLKNTTNQVAIWGLASRAQGEVISADSY